MKRQTYNLVRVTEGVRLPLDECYFLSDQSLVSQNSFFFFLFHLFIFSFQALLTFQEKHGGDLPRSYNEEDASEVCSLPPSPYLFLSTTTFLLSFLTFFP